MLTFVCSATSLIIDKSLQLVNVKKDDGFSALHLAALNGHRETAQILITEVGGKCIK